ncbi:hypothetical protein H5410_046741 [Solanum commersonii]|uniref:Uncharacterized protein n=1 Tax=Solanum commersonii TaxID=4109 RepID=A0A9J5XD40_SOLCO|nr:hypothetical protein H5410_046741 [Solanum commersonii]
MCCEGSLGEFSQNRRLTRQSALWSSSSPSYNCSTTYRLLLFTADLILYVKAQHIGTKGECPFFPLNSKYLKLKALNESKLWTNQQPQLKLLLVLKQTQVQPFKKGVSSSATQDPIMNTHNKTQFAYAKIKCALKNQVVTHQYQRISSSQHLLQMQVQAQPKCSNTLTQGMISYSHTIVYNLKLRNQMQRSHSQR